jgi:hypothetical protein
MCLLGLQLHGLNEYVCTVWSAKRWTQPWPTLTQHCAAKSLLLLMSLLPGPVKVMLPGQAGRGALAPKGLPHVTTATMVTLSWLLAGLSSGFVSTIDVGLSPGVVATAGSS